MRFISGRSGQIMSCTVYVTHVDRNVSLISLFLTSVLVGEVGKAGSEDAIYNFYNKNKRGHENGFSFYLSYCCGLGQEIKMKNDNERMWLVYIKDKLN